MNKDRDLALDFTNFKSRDAAWGAVLSNVLSGSFADARRLSVLFPEVKDADARLARSGLYFALARHHSLDWDHLDGGRQGTLARWKADWKPADLQEPLFDYAGESIDPDEPEWFNNRLVAFLNPDLAPREEAADDTAAVVYPWLRGLMRHRGVLDAHEERRLHHAISLITWELLDNIREWSKMTPEQNCSMVTFATRGQPNQLHVCVMDTGVGIVNSLRERLLDCDTSPEADVDLVLRALSNALPTRPNARGGGLPSVLDTIGRNQKGKFFLATGPASDGGAIVAEVTSDRRDDMEIRHIPGLPVQGTVVLVTLPFGAERKPDATSRRTDTGSALKVSTTDAPPEGQTDLF